MCAAFRRDPAKLRHWRTVLGEQRRSGLTIEAFCQSRSVASASFYYWKRELGKRTVERKLTGKSQQAATNRIAAVPPRFLPVRIEDLSQGTLPPATAILELVLPSGEVLRVATGFDPNTLAQVLGVLRGAHTC